MPWIGEEVEGSAAVHCLKHFAPEVEFHRVAAKQLKIRQAILPGAFRRIAEHRSGKIQADHMTSSETSGEGPCIDSGAAPKVEHEFIAREIGGGRDQGVLIQGPVSPPMKHDMRSLTALLLECCWPRRPTGT